MFETPTAQNVAEYLRAADEEAARQIVRPLKGRAGSSPAMTGPAGDRRPIFIAHPAGGTTACYRQLVDLLGDDQPVYGLERFEDAPPVEERAARYVRELLEAQPEGAFRLGGWSFGGVLAYETARQLKAAGREVEFVALFDAGLPLAVDDESDTLARRFSAFADYINETYGLEVALTYEELSGLDEESQFALVMERAAPLVDHIPLRRSPTSSRPTRTPVPWRRTTRSPTTGTSSSTTRPRRPPGPCGMRAMCSTGPTVSAGSAPTWRSSRSPVRTISTCSIRPVWACSPRTWRPGSRDGGRATPSPCRSRPAEGRPPNPVPRRTPPWPSPARPTPCSTPSGPARAVPSCRRSTCRPASARRSPARTRSGSSRARPTRTCAAPCTSARSRCPSSRPTSASSR
ncbi:thioesterase domain-containing protein [Actinomadura luteofluorescens]|uniref:thioesterase domain-containing protein n=1 Tax=Actinomadura luteofluorescens TaxID=46163 RepID=UPI003635F389